jgi:hypothetical protein
MKKGLLTVLFGAGLGAAAIFLSNKQNRQKAAKAYNDVMNSADDALDQISGTAEKTKSNKKVQNGVSKLKDLLN